MPALCPPPPIIRCEQAQPSASASVPCRLGDDTAVQVMVEDGAVQPLQAIATLPDGTRIRFPLAAKPDDLSSFMRDYLHVPHCDVSS